MKRLLFVVLLALPACTVDFGAVATSLGKCGASTDCLYDPHEQACGWRQTTELNGQAVELVRDNGLVLAAPDDECVRVRVTGSEDHMLVPSDTDACDVELEGSSCMVLLPGEGLTMFRRLGGEEGWGELAVGRTPVEICDLTCEGF